ncbi:MAG: 23S rRNA (adenine(1618)-N(6))-methyltransferase RlmF [Verrucomicrobia bacterium]|nr:23S rRNA (adenine(1618)-N(6))-methyltransferase RlmF [Verrucomicrobiota bacterium]
MHLNNIGYFVGKSIKKTSYTDSASLKINLHPRNKHRGRYDFKALIQSYPELNSFVFKNKYEDESIDFSNPHAVKALNKALLKNFYDVVWDIPEGYLCPPIPGRADYIHYIGDLLAVSNQGVVPTGPSICVLDIGTGANCIYPIIGHKEYGWKFIGSEIDPIAIDSAQKIIQSNNLSNEIKIRPQTSSLAIFKDVLQENEIVDISMCNPPFHSSLKEAHEGTKRKWKNLGIKKSSVLNFGGKENELSCFGGEAGFLKRMIQESALVQDRCRRFTTFVSKAENLPEVYKMLKEIKAIDVKTIEMAQGQKKSRIVAWAF